MSVNNTLAQQMKKIIARLAEYQRNLEPVNALLWWLLALYGLRLAALAGPLRPVRREPLILYGSLVLIYALFLAATWLAARRNEKFRRETGLRQGGGSLGVLLALGLGSLGLAAGLVGAGRTGFNLAGLSLELRLLVGFFVAGIVPLVEELLFRGLVFAYLLARLPGWLALIPFLPPALVRWPPHYWAISLTALAFALAHLGSSPLFLAVLFLGGLIYGAARWRSGSLWPSFAGHAAWNGAIYAGQFFFA